MVTKKKASTLGRLTVAMGLGVAVSTGHGIAAADPADGGASSSNESSAKPDSAKSATADANDGPSRPSRTENGEHATAGSPAVKDETSADEPGTKPTKPVSKDPEPKPDEPEPEPTPAPEPEPEPEPHPTPAPADPAPAPAASPSPEPPAAQSDTKPDHPKAPEPKPAATAMADVTVRTTAADEPAARTADPEPAVAARTLAARTSTTPAASTPSVDTPAPLAAAVAPAAPPRAVLGPLTGLLALFGIVPGAPGAPVNPIGQLVELIYVAVRRVEHLLFNNTPVVRSLDIGEQDADGKITGAVVAADPDPEDHLTYTVVSGPDRGSVALNPTDGTFTYTPDEATSHDQSGTVEFTVLVSDAASDPHLHLFSPGHTTTTRVVLTVEPVNHAPEIVSVATQSNTDGTTLFTVTARDTDADPITISAASDPARGTIAPVDSAATGPVRQFLFTPNADYAHQLSAGGSQTPGSVTLTFVATDGAATDTATVTVAIPPRNADPELTAVAAAPNADGSVVVTVTVQDADGDPIRLILPQPEHGALTGGVIYYEADGSIVGFVGVPAAFDLGSGDEVRFTYVPDRVADAPASETLTFTVDDDHGAVVTAAAAAMIALPNDDPGIAVALPVVVDPSRGTVRYAVTVTDPDGDDVTLTSTDPDHVTIVKTGQGAYTVTYTPDAGVAHDLSEDGSTTPRVVSFTLVATDTFDGGRITPVEVSIRPYNTAPTQSAPADVGAADADGLVIGQVSFGDAENDTLTYSASSTKGSVQIDDRGVFQFTPTNEARRQAAAPDATYADTHATVVVVGTDGHGGSVSVDVTVDVLPAVNNPPYFIYVDRHPGPTPGTTEYIVPAFDLDNDPLTFTATLSDPAKGTLTTTSTSPRSRVYLFTPSAAYAHELSAGGSQTPGAAGVTFTVSDGKDSVSRSLDSVVTPTNASPVLTAAAGDPATDGRVTVDVTVTDADGDDVAVTIPQPAYGSITNVVVARADGSVTGFTGVPSTVSVQSGDRIRLTFQPTVASSAPDSETLTFVGDDAHGGIVQASVDVAVAVNAAPNVTVGTPVVVDPSRGTVRFPVTVTDPDGDPITLSSSDSGHVSIVATSPGTYDVTYTPDAGLAHQLSEGGGTTPRVVNFVLVAVDEQGNAQSTAVTVSIAPYNTAPRQSAPAARPSAPGVNGAVTGRVSVTDADQDPVGFTGSSTKGSVAVNADGTFTFTPTAAARTQAGALDATADDRTATVSVVADDGHGGTVTIRVAVAVLPADAIVFADRAQPRDVTVLGTSGRIAVWTGSEVRIVNASTGEVVDTVSIGGARSVAVSSDGKYVYVGRDDIDGQPRPVLKYDVEAGTQTPMGQVWQPAAMALSADGGTLYVTNYQIGTVTVINTATGATSSFNPDVQTDAIALGNGKVYVGSILNRIKVYDLATGTLTTVTTGSQFVSPQSIAVGGPWVYVTDGLSGTTVMIDAATNTVAATIATGANPASVATTANGAYAYVANQSDGTVAVVSSASRSVVKTIQVGSGPSRVDLSADGSTLYVTTTTGVRVIKVADLNLGGV